MRENSSEKEGFMTEYEYAALIYCQVFCVENADGDIYVRGILDAINELWERARRTLEMIWHISKSAKKSE